jgi:hypothetical protein
MVARTNLTEAETLFIQRQRVAPLATAERKGIHTLYLSACFEGALLHPVDEVPNASPQHS